MKSICLLQLFLQIVLRGRAQAQDPKLLVIYPSNGVAKEGEKLELQCRYSPRITCFYWFKNSIQISGCSSYTYKKVADGVSGGSYQCGVRLDYWKKSEPVDVVTIASNMNLSLKVRPKEARSGENIILKCLLLAGELTGPKVFLWYRNEELIARNDQSQYTIRRAKRSDGGSYRCELQINYRKWIAAEVNITVTVPVAVLTSNNNRTEISAGDRLILHCQVKAGTARHFHWYFNNQRLQNTSKSYNFSMNGRVLIIESFQGEHGGRYHCVATNRGTSDFEFNTTSNFIDVTLRVHSYTPAITALVVILLVALIVAILLKKRNKRKGNSSSFSQPQRKPIGNETQPSSKESSGSNFVHAVAGSNTNTASSSDQPTQCPVKGLESREADTNTAAHLLYSTVTIKKSSDGDNGAGVSGGVRRNKSGSSGNCVAYSLVNHGKSKAGLEGNHLEEGDGRDASVYDNLPLK